VAAGALTALPYLAMLVVMVTSQYVQQWHATAGQSVANNPQAQATQMVTRIMPLFIGVVSYQFPAGLVLYWVTSNIFRLGQQIVIFKIDGRPQLVASEPHERSKAEGSPGGSQTPQPGAGAKKKRRRRR
jgi:membrane protein insertase Oxa1/YidC/SpoIIIJ